MSKPDPDALAAARAQLDQIEAATAERLGPDGIRRAEVLAAQRRRPSEFQAIRRWRPNDPDDDINPPK